MKKNILIIILIFLVILFFTTTFDQTFNQAYLTPFLTNMYKNPLGKIILNFLSFQKLSAIRNGSPVWEEKNISLPKVKKWKSLSGSIKEWLGGRPRWVRLMKTDLIKTKTAILLTTKGILCGFQSRRMITNTQNRAKPS